MTPNTNSRVTFTLLRDFERSVAGVKPSRTELQARRLSNSTLPPSSHLCMHSLLLSSIPYDCACPTKELSPHVIPKIHLHQDRAPASPLSIYRIPLRTTFISCMMHSINSSNNTRVCKPSRARDAQTSGRRGSLGVTLPSSPYTSEELFTGNDNSLWWAKMELVVHDEKGTKNTAVLGWIE